MRGENCASRHHDFISIRLILLGSALLAYTISSYAADDQDPPAGKEPVGTVELTAAETEQHLSSQWTASPICLSANELSIATGQPSLVMMSNGAAHIPVWSLSGGTVGQSVSGLVALPAGSEAVKIEIIVTTNDKATSPPFEDVYRVHLSQMIEGAPFSEKTVSSAPVRTALPAEAFYTRTILLESYYGVDPRAPLGVRIERKPDDPADSFTRPTGLAMVKVSPLKAPATPYVVQDAPGYNSWPMIQALGDTLVCVYSRGTEHAISKDLRACYARISTDYGKTWSKETVFADTPQYGEVVVGKGLDAKGAMLVWVRRIGKDWNHDLYRTTDGVQFELVTTPEFAVTPMQITDVFEVPTIGLMALWFAGDYRADSTNHSWGKVVSTDNGATWTQTTIESGLIKDHWPTEPSAVYLGDGRILAIGRTEGGGTCSTRTQFQMVSMDYGATWQRTQTNIGEVCSSTPSLILDAETGLLSNYYYQRGRGILRRRVVDPEIIFDQPLHWPGSEAVAIGSEIGIDSGNVNATAIRNTHYLAFYSGKAPDTAILVSVVPAVQRIP